MKDLLHDYRDCFEEVLLNPGQMKGVECNVPLLPGAKPVYLKDYRRSLKEHEQIQEEMQRKLKLGVVEPADSEWASNPLLVPKKTGEKRMCVNYWKVNQMTIGDVFPLPRMDDMFDAVNQAKLFSLLDATSGYWQVPFKKEDRHIAAFNTREGLFQPTVMDFGLKRSPATWQRVMNTTFNFEDYCGRPV